MSLGGRSGPGTDPDNGVPAAQILRNLADELTVALGICVNVEEIVADRLLKGGAEGKFARVELQNIDRLIQMLTDFRSLSSELAKALEPQHVPADLIGKSLIMEEMSRRLLSQTPTRKAGAPALGGSDVTFF